MLLSSLRVVAPRLSAATLQLPVLALAAALMFGVAALGAPFAAAQTVVEEAAPAKADPAAGIASPGADPAPSETAPATEPAATAGRSPEPEALAPDGLAANAPAVSIRNEMTDILAGLNQLDNESKLIVAGSAILALLLLGFIGWAISRSEPLRRAFATYWSHAAILAAVLTAYALGYLTARQISYILLSVAVFAGIQRFLKTELARRFIRVLSEDVVTNWRLLLLGLTGILLSIASGYTTWDGMTNFTCPARSAEEGACFGPMILSGLITFGIQGVMLIAAWLIGESFAQGLRTGTDETAGSLQKAARYLIAVPLAGMALLALAAVASIFLSSDANRLANGIAGFSGSITTLFAVLIAATAILFALSHRQIIKPYEQGLRIILANLPIWIMFTACMATSVFFSFDSLFSSIFPPEERARAAELRTSNQVAGLVSDVGVNATRRQIEAIEELFSSEEWTEYSERIGAIVDIARAAPEEIEKLQRAEMESRQATRASLQERKASALGQQKRLGTRKESLIETLGRLKEEIPPVAATVEEQKRKVFDLDKQIIGKKAEAEAEAGGVGGTGKAGRGPEFAKRKKELDDLAKLKAIEQATLDEFVGQVRSKRDAVANAEAELAAIDAEIGKMQGEIEVAEGQITIATEAGQSAPRIDVSGGFATLDAAFGQFRQRPERATFDAMQSHCAVLLNVFEKVPSLKSEAEARRVTCDPSTVAERTARVFALNEGLVAFKAACARPDSLPQTGTDAVLEFGERCIQVSGLSAKDTALLRGDLNGIALNRDDRAHRFVVTWNAFLDGNRLAYLALAIALAIDGLVFMSGLFGANAVRSRLSDLPGGKDRSASDLEAMIDTALLPNTYANARLVLDSMRPITETEGYAARVDLAMLDAASANIVSRVLTQGATLGAVRQDQADPDLFLVRGQLIEYLSVVCKRELSRSEAVRKDAEAERMVAEQRRIERDAASNRSRQIGQRVRDIEPVLWASLLPYRYESAVLVKAFSRPLARSTDNDFAADIDLWEVRSQRDGLHRLLSGVLSAGAALDAVVRDSANNERYLLRPEFTMCMSLLVDRAREERRNSDGRDVLLAEPELNALLLAAPSPSPPPAAGGGALASIAIAGRPEAGAPEALQQLRSLGKPATVEADTTGPTRDDAASLNEARTRYEAEYLRQLGISHEEAQSIISQEREIRAQLDFLRNMTGPQEQIDELTRHWMRTIDEKHHELSARSTDDARIVLEDVTSEMKKLVPGVVLRSMPSDAEADYRGAIN
jgi:hypothetical protein